MIEVLAVVDKELVGGRGQTQTVVNVSTKAKVAVAVALFGAHDGRDLPFD